MFNSFPAELRKHGLHSDVRTILQLYTLMSSGLISNLGGLYSAGERLVVKGPRQKGPYTVAFFAHFLDIHIQPGQTLDAAVAGSEAFNSWRLQNAPGKSPSAQLVDEFLESVLNRHPNLQRLAAEVEEQLEQMGMLNVPFSEVDENQENPEVDHSEQDLAEILKKMREMAEQQKEAHNGGKKYIGTRGTSPYGHAGRASGGVRIGGQGAHRSARMVLNDPRYFPLDMNALLGDNNIDAALAALKGVAERTVRLKLDVEETIRMGAKRSGLFIPQMKTEETDEFSVLLFIDNGGFSMDQHIPHVRTLFQKMQTRFGHDLRLYYFHNIIDDVVYKDQSRMREPVRMESILREGRHHSVFIVGDASMAPYELHSAGSSKSGFDYLRAMASAFPKLAWLNPVAEGAWGHTETIGDIRAVVKMFPLTPRGIEKAVAHLNQLSAKRIEER